MFKFLVIFLTSLGLGILWDIESYQGGIISFIIYILLSTLNKTYEL